jgi:hypothetical protein
MASNNLTAAQQKAINWLPNDGAWRTKPGRLTAALNSLSLRGLCEGEWANCGPRGGMERRWRLSIAGIELIKAPSE